MLVMRWSKRLLTQFEFDRLFSIQHSHNPDANTPLQVHARMCHASTLLTCHDLFQSPWPRRWTAPLSRDGRQTPVYKLADSTHTKLIIVLCEQKNQTVKLIHSNVTTLLTPPRVNAAVLRVIASSTLLVAQDKAHTTPWITPSCRHLALHPTPNKRRKTTPPASSQTEFDFLSCRFLLGGLQGGGRGSEGLLCAGPTLSGL